MALSAVYAHFSPIVLMCKYLRFAVRSKQAKLSAQQSESTAAHEFSTFCAVRWTFNPMSWLVLVQFLILALGSRIHAPL